MVIQGGTTTTPVTVADIAYHSRCVAPHLQRAFLVADLPFLSYATLERALDASQRLMQEGGAKMVKLEGGREQASIVEYLRSEEHTSELQSLLRISYAVFCLKKKKTVDT